MNLFFCRFDGLCPSLRSFIIALAFFMAAGCGSGGGDSAPAPSVTTDMQAVESAQNSLTFDTIKGSNLEASQIIADLNLVTAIANDTSVSWNSSNIAVIAADGAVTRPATGEGNVSITLTASVSRGDASTTKVFVLTVLEMASLFEYAYQGGGYGIDHVDTPRTDGSDVEITYNLYLDDWVKDVYFIFTNTDASDATDFPEVSSLNSVSPEEEMEAAAQKTEALIEWARNHGVGLNGRPDITLFNSDPQKYSGRSFGYSPYSALLEPELAPSLADAVEDTAPFFLERNTSTQLDATCRKVVPGIVSSGKTRTLNIWVADNAWTQGDGCALATCVTQDMVNAIADKFLKPGEDNDIYDWVTNIYGAEWGENPYSVLLAPDDNITILLYDIDGDNSVSGGTLGYFWSKDNYKLSETVPYTNERVMFYMDSVLFAKSEGSWEITDYWPEIMLSTLAHEFQHMIHFYQKYVTFNTGSSETWLNEMCSEVTSDFVARKLGISGPRGVSYLDGSAGGTGNTDGRLPRYARFSYIPVAQWMTGSYYNSGDGNVLNSYAVSYAFGAYLARNYGGAELFRNIVQNGSVDSAAIDTALAATVYADEDFKSMLRKWGAGVLLSDDPTTSVPEGYRYNTGTSIDVAYNGMTYDLGSINLFNYDYGSQSGPRIYTTLPPSDSMAGKYKTSNMFYKLGSSLTGRITKSITLRKGTKLTVVVK